MAAQALTILNTIIHRRGDLYSLNDLHKASGSAIKPRLIVRFGAFCLQSAVAQTNRRFSLSCSDLS